MVPGNAAELPAARPARSVRRSARTRVCGQRRMAPLMRYAGAGSRLSCLPRARREACGAPRAPEFVGSVALLRSSLRGSGQSAELPSARPARSVRRSARTRVCGQRRMAPLARYAGAGNRLSCLPRARREACGAPRAPEFVGSVAWLRSGALRLARGASASRPSAPVRSLRQTRVCHRAPQAPRRRPLSAVRSA